MANGIRIDNLDSATVLNDTDVMTIVQDGTNKQMSMSLLDKDGSYSQSVINTIPDLITTSKSNVETARQAIDEKFDEDEFSAQINTVQEMSNIGVSDDGSVDVSSQVQDGFMETATLYGKTLVNNITVDTNEDDYVAFDQDYEGQNFSISGTVEGAIQNTIIQGSTKYRDVDTDEILDEFDDTKSLELVSVVLPQSTDENKIPILQTHSKNLFDGKYYQLGDINTKGEQINSGNYYVTDYIKVEPNKNIIAQGNGNVNGRFFFYDINKNYLSLSYLASAKPIIPDDCKYIRARFEVTTTKDTVMIEYGTSISSYEPYKSNILYSNEEVILRGIGNVYDTIDIHGNKVENIDEIILDGSDDEHWSFAKSKTSTIIFYSDITNQKAIKFENKEDAEIVMCKYFPTTSIDLGSFDDIDLEGIYTAWDGNICIAINKSKLSDESIDTFKSYLQSNPITVQYKLQNKINSTIPTTITDQDNIEITDIHAFDTTTYIETNGENLIPFVTIDKDVEYPVMLKPNTTYTVYAQTNGNAMTVNVGGTESTFTNKMTIATPSTLTNNTLSYYRLGAKANSIMLVEGIETRDLDYFTGMQLVKIGNQIHILTITGKNLIIEPLEITTDMSIFRINKLTNGTYTWTVNGYTMDGGYVALLDDNGSQFVIQEWGKITRTFTVPNDGKSYVKIKFWKSGFTYDDDLMSVQLEQGSVATSYELYKSSILSTENDLIMRSNGSVRDSLDIITGKFTQRIDEDGNILDTPIETTIDINTDLGDEKLPIVYKGGHILLESDELTPELQYSIPISYSGLIAQNTMTNLKHSWRLDELELMAYASIVNSQYDSLMLVATAESSDVEISKVYSQDESLYQMLKVLVNANALQNADDKIAVFYLYGKLSDEMYLDLIGVDM